MPFGMKYDIALPQTVSEILEQDFWMLEHVGPDLVRSQLKPVKFSACVPIFLRRGECVVDLNLVEHHVKAPCMVNVSEGQIIQVKQVSADFDASFMVVSKRMVETLFMLLNNNTEFVMAHRLQVVPVVESDLAAFDAHYATLRQIQSAADNPHRMMALAYEIAGFFLRTAWRSYAAQPDPVGEQAYISQQFLMMVQRRFKTERFLEYYANEMGISTKHLSRTVKHQTGISAVSWIERFVLLEARVMLRSSTLTIQQIAEELNFPTQSLFGKYFKKGVGMTPKEYRNSRT